MRSNCRIESRDKSRASSMLPQLSRDLWLLSKIPAGLKPARKSILQFLTRPSQLSAGDGQARKFNDMHSHPRSPAFDTQSVWIQGAQRSVMCLSDPWHYTLHNY
jgi:hypothetical protein